ncbi:MAG TPA: hypothetical protein VGO34_11135 [Alphaproteobacteria bacterium]|jgi:hypothetical protein
MVWRKTFAGSAVGMMIAAVGIAYGGEMQNASVVSVGRPALAVGTTRMAVPQLADQLSPGNRLIAEALFAGQDALAPGRGPWSLERIASSRMEGRNWGEIFQQMKGENLLRSETLGQVVTWYQYNYVTPEPDTGAIHSDVATMPVSGN